MGAWSAAILGNDTSCEVRERFLELYDSGYPPEKIARSVLDEQAENLKYDRTNVWLGLALACWECKVLTKDIFDEVKEIIDSEEDIRYCAELDADTAFLIKRQSVLEAFVTKIGKEKEKPRARKKIPVEAGSIYSAGTCLAYKTLQDKYTGIFLTNAEHFRFKGEVAFWFLDFESDVMPGLDSFSNAKLFGLKKLGPEWGQRLYMGNTSRIVYVKGDKAFFFKNMPLIFTVVGNLKTPDPGKFTNASQWSTMKLDDPGDIVSVVERVREEGKLKHPLADLTLGKLLNEIGIDDQ